MATGAVVVMVLDTNALNLTEIGIRPRYYQTRPAYVRAEQHTGPAALAHLVEVVHTWRTAGLVMPGTTLRIDQVDGDQVGILGVPPERERLLRPRRWLVLRTDRVLLIAPEHYTPRPEWVEAIQHTGPASLEAMLEWSELWVREGLLTPDTACAPTELGTTTGLQVYDTRRHLRLLAPGDWLVRAADRALHVYRHWVFDAQYEPVR
jgi:hypothetical protein